MKKMLKYFSLIIGICVMLTSCSEYGRLLKSKDNQKKYDKAMELFADEDYGKSLTLLEDILPFYKLRKEGQEVYYAIAKCYYENREYYTASFYLKTFSKSYPDNEKAEEAGYLGAYCLYLISPDYKLDQMDTENALSAFQLFLDTYPKSQWTDESHTIIDELRVRLEKKAYEGAKQYYTLENYKAAITSLNNFIDEYPGSEHSEQAWFLCVKAHYLLSNKSVDSKKEERFKETIKSYRTFVAAFPESKKLRELESIKKNSEREIEEMKSIVSETKN